VQRLIVKLFGRLSHTYHDLSLFSFCLLIFGTPLRRVKRVLDNRAISRAVSVQDLFTLIWERNAWGSTESASGIGSTPDFTESIRSLLPVLARDFRLNQFLMPHVEILTG